LALYEIPRTYKAEFASKEGYFIFSLLKEWRPSDVFYNAGHCCHFEKYKVQSFVDLFDSI